VRRGTARGIYVGVGPTAKNADTVRTARLIRSLVRGDGPDLGDSTTVSRGLL
jgi:hypothetical protein